MRHSFLKGHRGTALLCVLVLGIVALVTIVPRQLTTQASANKLKLYGDANVTRSYNPEIPNYDIRTDKGSSSVLAGYRQGMNFSDFEMKAVRQELRHGEEALTRTIP